MRRSCARTEECRGMRRTGPARPMGHSRPEPRPGPRGSPHGRRRSCRYRRSKSGPRLSPSRAPRKTTPHGPIQMDRIEDRRRHDVAARARQSRREGRRLVRGMRGRKGPGAISGSGWHAPHRPLPSPRSIVPFRVECSTAQRGSGWIHLGVTAGAGTREVARRGRLMAVPASDRGRWLRPDDGRLCAPLSVAVHRAGGIGSVIRGVSTNHGRIEADLDDAVAVEPSNDGRTGQRMACRARHAAGALRRGFDMGRMRPSVSVRGEEARIARRVRPGS